MTPYDSSPGRIDTREHAERPFGVPVSQLVALMPAALYTCDAQGRLTFYNRQAAELWGREPRLGDEHERYCGSFRIWKPSGELLRHEDCAMADAVREARPARNLAVIIEQPSGKRVAANVNIDPLYDREHRVVGAICVFVDVTVRRPGDDVVVEDAQQPAAPEGGATLLDRIGKQLARLSTPDEIMQTVGSTLGQFLGASAAVFCDVDENANEVTVKHGWIENHSPSLKQTFRLSEYVTPELARASRGGENFIVRDTRRDPRVDPESHARLNVGAYVVVPALSQGRWTAYLAVIDPSARDWRRSDIELIEEVAERLFLRIERARAEAALRESEQRFQQFAAASSGALWIRDARTLAMEYVSPAISGIYGIEPGAFLGDVRLWAASIVPEDRERALQLIEQARAGVAVVHEFRIQRTTDRQFRWIRNTDFPLFDEQGNVQRIGGIAEDVTDTRLATEHQGVLLAELQHRVRNIMAIIRAITARTGLGAESVAEYGRLLEGRLLALSRVQALLTRMPNVGVDLATLLRDEMNAQAPVEAQHVLEGPRVDLSPKAAEILTLAVHELATNALKYGAFSVATGKVTVRWSVAERAGVRWLVFDWWEEGVRVPAERPRRRGFGSELIEGRIPYELSGTGKVVIGPNGAHCHLEFPLEDGISILETGAPRRATVFGGALDMRGEPDLAGRRVLVVEDEYYIASDTARALQGAGAEILGPCSSEGAARAELSTQRPDAAVVDINLGRGPSFSLAELLHTSGIPFVFVTGYDQEVIPEKFVGVERLQKPVQLRQMVEAIARLVS